MSKIREEAEAYIRYVEENGGPCCEPVHAERVLLLEKAYRYQRAAFNMVNFLWLNLYEDSKLHQKFTTFLVQSHYLQIKAIRLYKQAKEL